MTEQETNNLMIDLGAVCASQIPYVGGPASAVLPYFKTGDEVITWDEIKDYVDAEISKAQLQSDIDKVNLDIDSLVEDFKNYSESLKIEEGYPDSEHWSQIDYLFNLATSINQYLFAADGYDSFSNDKLSTSEGLWRRSPWGVTMSASRILALTYSIIGEMIALNSRALEKKADGVEENKNWLDESGRIKECIQISLKAYSRTFDKLIGLAYEQRMSMLNVTDYMKKTSSQVVVDPMSGIYQTNYYYNFKFKWSDKGNPDVGKSYSKEVKKSSSNRVKQEKVISPMRVDLLDYKLSLHKQTVKTLFDILIDPLNTFFKWDDDSRQNEIKARKKTGLVFGGIDAEIYGYHKEGNYAKIRTTLYCMEGRPYIPALQFSKDNSDHGSTWTFGGTQKATKEEQSAPTAKFGIMRYYDQFDSSWVSESKPLIWNEAEASENGYIMTKVNGINGKYDYMKARIKWFPPKEPVAPET